jgi:hypothetical protein
MNITDVTTTNCEWTEDEIKLDETINSYENIYTNICIIPIVGILSAGALSLICAAQGVASIIFGGTTFLPFSSNYGNTKLRSRCWVHLKHAIMASLSVPGKAFPIYGTLVVGLIRTRAFLSSELTVGVITGHENKLYAYESLVARDWKIDGTDSEKVNKARIVYKELIASRGEINLSLDEKLELAHTAVNQVRTSKIDAYKETAQTILKIILVILFANSLHKNKR